MSQNQELENSDDFQNHKSYQNQEKNIQDDQQLREAKNRIKQKFIEQLGSLDQNEREDKNEKTIHNIKRLQLKTHQHQILINQMEDEINFYEDFFKQDNSKLRQEYLYSEEITTLEFIQEEIERENIDLEKECFQYGTNEESNHDHASHIQNIIEEFKENQKNELEKQKKNNLYIKKEYDKHILEQEQEMNQLIDKLMKKINYEMDKVEHLEKLDLEVLENISLTQRYIQKEKLKMIEQQNQ